MEAASPTHTPHDPPPSPPSSLKRPRDANDGGDDQPTVSSSSSGPSPSKIPRIDESPAASVEDPPSLASCVAEGSTLSQASRSMKIEDGIEPPADGIEPDDDKLAAGGSCERPSDDGMAAGGASATTAQGDDDNNHTPPGNAEKLAGLVRDVENELWCGVCTAIFHRPVTVLPCSHSACGSCLKQYLDSSSPAPSNCPSCRSPATSAHYARNLSTLVDILTAHAPEKGRSQIERDQADAIWSIGMPLKFSLPPPPPAPPRPSELYRPCRYCPRGSLEIYGWECPIPVPLAGAEVVYPLDGPCPPGHLVCASCSRLAAIGSPSARSCFVCEDGYCGLNGQACSPQLLSLATPLTSHWGRTNAELANAVYDPPCDELMNGFRDNMEELKCFGDFIKTRPELTATSIFAEILAWVQSEDGIAQGGVRGIFRRVDEGIHSNLAEDKATDRVCHGCSDDLFACGLWEWWLRKRQIPEVFSSLDKATQRKPDCKNGRQCYRQGNSAHAKKFNHVVLPLPREIADTIHQDDIPLPPPSPAPAPPSSDSDHARSSVSPPPSAAPASDQNGAVAGESGDAVVQVSHSDSDSDSDSDDDNENLRHVGIQTCIEDLASSASASDTVPSKPQEQPENAPSVEVGPSSLASTFFAAPIAPASISSTTNFTHDAHPHEDARNVSAESGDAGATDENENEDADRTLVAAADDDDETDVPMDDGSKKFAASSLVEYVEAETSVASSVEGESGSAAAVTLLA